MTKVISLSEEAYNRLYNLKKGKESFSDVVLKITEKSAKGSLLDYAGLWAGDEEINRIFEKIAKERKEAKMREVKL